MAAPPDTDPSPDAAVHADAGGADGASGEQRDGPEQRGPRKPIELRVEYKRLNAFFADYTRNISQGGTFIKTDRPLAVGTEFVFKLHVPALAEPLSITGRVKWVRTPEDIDAALDEGAFDGPRDPGMGIRFVFRDPDERGALESRVEALMVDSLGQLISSRLMEQRERGGAPDALASDARPALGAAEVSSVSDPREDP